MTVARVYLASLGQEVSALGFGCASLGSRVAPAAGLAALERAFDAGVTWYDVAPSYGDGQAETLLGRFIAGKRDTVQVLTKVGIAPPPPSLKQRLARPVARALVAIVPGAKAAIRKRRPPPVKPPLDAAMIPVSLDASLRRLGTDHVDVLALHDATPEEAARDDVLAALALALSSGKARAVAIASSPEAAAAGLAASDTYGLVQMANNPGVPGLAQLAALAPDATPDRVSHSVYGKDGAIAGLAARIGSDAAVRSALVAQGYDSAPAQAAADFLADYAFATNQSGVVLVSMFAARHLAANLARHARRRDAAAIVALAARLDGISG